MAFLKAHIGRNGLPSAPPEIASEVELYARESGRTATLHFVPFGGWFARFSLRSNDPRMRAYQEGTAPELPGEDVWLHVTNPRAGMFNARGQREPDYVALDIYQMGASGVRQFLERGNTWSGRGEFASHLEALRKNAQHNEDRRKRMRAQAKENSRLRQRDVRRTRFKIPFLRPIGGWLDLLTGKGSTSTTQPKETES